MCNVKKLYFLNLFVVFRIMKSSLKNAQILETNILESWRLIWNSIQKQTVCMNQLVMKNIFRCPWFSNSLIQEEKICPFTAPPRPPTLFSEKRTSLWKWWRSWNCEKYVDFLKKMIYACFKICCLCLRFQRLCVTLEFYRCFAHFNDVLELQCLQGMCY